MLLHYRSVVLHYLSLLHYRLFFITLSVDITLSGIYYIIGCNRRRDTRLSLLYQIIKGKVAVDYEGTLIQADSRTRSSHQHKLKHLSARSAQHKNSFFVATVPQWNILPQALVSVDTTTAFKAQLRTYAP